MANKEKQSTFLQSVKWALYSAKIKFFGLFHKNKPEGSPEKRKGMVSAKRRETVFLCLFALFPVLQFLLFYVGVNVNSIKLAFQKFEGEQFVFAGLDNFKEVWQDIFSADGDLIVAVKNSLIQFVFTSVLGIPVHIAVAYAVFKNVPFSGFFKIMLFMPSMISSMVFVICGKEIISEAFPILFNNPALNLLNKKATSSFWTVLIFGYWMNFASGLIIYLSAMASISTDIMEYGKLERLTSVKELLYVVVPSIYPTIVTYVVVALAGFFTNGGFFFSFFGGNALTTQPYDTLGYVFFVKISGDDATQQLYPYASAGGLMFTVVIAPITITVKWLMEKFGPSED